MSQAGRVELLIEAEAQRATQALDRLNASLRKTRQVIEQLTGALGEISTGTRAVKDFDKTQKTATANTRNWFRQIARLTAAFFALRRIIRWVGQAFWSAMDYEEVTNLFQTVFRKIGLEAGKEFEMAFLERAEEFNRRISEAFIVDPKILMDHQARFAQMADSMGLVTESSYLISESLSALALDVASLRNIVDVNEAMEKLQAGIAGQIRPLRRWGVDISKTSLQHIALRYGIEDSIEVMDAAAKVQLRYLAIMEQLTVAMGDMPRTFESPANQLRVLKQQWQLLNREIGNIFMPLIRRVLPWLNAIVISLRRIAEEIAVLVGYEAPDWTHTEIYLGTDDVIDGLDEATDAANRFRNAIFGFDELNIFPQAQRTGPDMMGSGYAILDAAIAREHAGYMERLNAEIETMSRRAEELADIVDPFLRTTLRLLPLIGAALAGLKLGTGKGIFGGILIMITRFAYLVTFSENFRAGLARIWDMMKNLAGAVKEMFPPETQESIANFFDRVIQWANDLDLDLGDLSLTLLGIGLLFTPGKPFGIALIVFELLTVLVRWLGSTADETSERFVAFQDRMGEFVDRITGPFKDAWEEYGESITETFGSVWERLKKIFGQIVEMVKLWLDHIKQMWDDWGWIIKFLWDVLWGSVVSALVFALDLLGTALDSGLQTLSGILDIFIGIFTGDWERAWDGFVDVIRGAVNLAIGLVNSLIGAFEIMLNTVGKAINNLPSIKLPKALGGWEFGIPEIPKVSFRRIPKLADGGIPGFGQLFIANEDGPELVGSFGNQTGVMNNDQIVASVKRGVYEAVSAAMSESGGDVRVPVYIDGKKVFEATSSAEQRRTIRAGRRVSPVGG